MNRKYVTLAVLLVLLVAACASDQESAVESSAIPQELSWVTPEELTEKLSAGPATVVNFWASWCGPCRAEAPVLRRSHQDYGDQVRFIGVAIDDNAAGAFDFMDAHEISFQNYLAEGGSMMSEYGAFGIPFTVFTDAKGEVLNVHRGIIDEKTLGLWVDELSRLG